MAMPCSHSGRPSLLSVRSLIAIVALALAASSCGGSNAELETLESFDAYPLLWAGEEFEGLKVTHVELGGPKEFTTIVCGTCEPSGGDDPSCTPPLQLQVQPLCAHLAEVARSPIWARRTIRARVQVKAYRGEGSDPKLAWRALVALRSANRVPPVVESTGPIPAPNAGVLAGTRPCSA